MSQKCFQASGFASMFYRVVFLPLALAMDSFTAHRFYIGMTPLILKQLFQQSFTNINFSCIKKIIIQRVIIDLICSLRYSVKIEMFLLQWWSRGKIFFFFPAILYSNVASLSGSLNLLIYDVSVIILPRKEFAKSPASTATTLLTQTNLPPSFKQKTLLIHAFAFVHFCY